MNYNYLVGGVSVAALIVVGFLLFVQSSVGEEPLASASGEGSVPEQSKYEALAKCLTAKNVVMYGSATCASCARERKLFGSAFEYIAEVECHPRNPNPQTERCIAKNISHTPTFIIEDADGSEVKRMPSGYQTAKALSEFSGCPL